MLFFSVANWGLPLAAMSDMKRDPEYISGRMTTGRGMNVNKYSDDLMKWLNHCKNITIKIKLSLVNII